MSTDIYELKEGVLMTAYCENIGVHPGCCKRLAGFGRVGVRIHIDVILKMAPIYSPETSVLNQPTLRNITEDGRIQLIFDFFFENLSRKLKFN